MTNTVSTTKAMLLGGGIDPDSSSTYLIVSINNEVWYFRNGYAPSRYPMTWFLEKFAGRKWEPFDT